MSLTIQPDATDDEVTVLSTYPFPFRVNFGVENPQGDYEVRQIQFLPGEMKSISRAVHEHMKANSKAYQRALDTNRIHEGPDKGRASRERKTLSRNMLDTSLIEDQSKVARDTGVSEVAQDQVEKAERILQQAKQSGGRVMTSHLPG